MSEASRQKQLLSEGFLDTLGSEPQSVTAMPAVEAMLQSFALMFLEKAAKNLIEANSVSTGELSSSLTFFVDKTETGYTLSVGYPEGSAGSRYYDFVNKGVVGLNDIRGSNSVYKFRNYFISDGFLSAMLKWLKIHGLQSKNETQKHNLTALQTKRKSVSEVAAKPKPLESIAWGIAVNIKKNGLRRTGYFDNAIEQTFTDAFLSSMAAAVGQDIRFKIRQTFNF